MNHSQNNGSYDGLQAICYGKLREMEQSVLGATETEEQGWGVRSKAPRANSGMAKSAKERSKHKSSCCFQGSIYLGGILLPTVAGLDKGQTNITR